MQQQEEQRRILHDSFWHWQVAPCYHYSRWEDALTEMKGQKPFWFVPTDSMVPEGPGTGTMRAHALLYSVIKLG